MEEGVDMSVFEESFSSCGPAESLRDGDVGRPRAHIVKSFGPGIAVCVCIGCLRLFIW